MKSLHEIKQKAEKADYSRVAEIVNMSQALVRRVIAGIRTDHHNIQRVFSDVLESRERLTQREQARRQRKAAREKNKLQNA